MNIFRTMKLVSITALVATVACRQTANEPPAQPDQKITVPDADLARIREAAIFAETANAAGLDWKPYYDAFMQLERESGRPDNKISIIEAYFRAIQGQNRQRLREKKYTEDEVRTLQHKLADDTSHLRTEAPSRKYWQIDIYDDDSLATIVSDPNRVKWTKSIIFCGPDSAEITPNRLQELKNLSDLIFYHVNNPEKVIRAAREMESIEEIVFDGNTALNDETIKALGELRHLRKVHIDQSVDEKTLDKLRVSLPNVTIEDK